METKKEISVHASRYIVTGETAGSGKIIHGQTIDRGDGREEAEKGVLKSSPKRKEEGEPRSTWDDGWMNLVVGSSNSSGSLLSFFSSRAFRAAENLGENEGQIG